MASIDDTETHHLTYCPVCTSPTIFGKGFCAECGNSLAASGGALKPEAIDMYARDVPDSGFIKVAADRLILERLAHWLKLFRGLVVAPLVLVVASLSVWGIFSFQDLQAKMHGLKETIATEQATADKMKPQLAELALISEQVNTLRYTAFSAIINSISNMSSAQALALANLMEVHITEHDSNMQQLIKLWDPHTSRLRDGNKAKRLLMQWAAMDSRNYGSIKEWQKNLNIIEQQQQQRELFAKTTFSRSEVEAEQALEIKAGAIRSSIQDDGTNWVLVTEWNVLRPQ